MANEAKSGVAQPAIQRIYKVAQAFTGPGLQTIVNNMLTAEFLPLGGVSVTLIGERHGESEVLHTQAMFYASDGEGPA